MKLSLLNEVDDRLRRAERGQDSARYIQELIRSNRISQSDVLVMYQLGDERAGEWYRANYPESYNVQRFDERAAFRAVLSRDPKLAAAVLYPMVVSDLSEEVRENYASAVPGYDGPNIVDDFNGIINSLNDWVSQRVEGSQSGSQNYQGFINTLNDWFRSLENINVIRAYNFHPHEWYARFMNFIIGSIRVLSLPPSEPHRNHDFDYESPEATLMHPINHRVHNSSEYVGAVVKAYIDKVWSKVR